MNSGLNPAVQIRVPKLLVSVRSAAEARAAIAGGADVIDVKEPRRGSLGMADGTVMAAVFDAVRSIAPELPVSVALGELLECELPLPRLPDGVTFAKTGLAGAANTADWPDRWRTVRRAVERPRSSPVRWVGVAYADAGRAGAPAVDDLIVQSARAGCAGLLIDTFSKSEGALLSLADEEQLGGWVRRAHGAGLFVALAGRIAVSDLQHLREIPTDVIAVRSAVCRGQQRGAELSGELVAGFRKQMREAFLKSGEAEAGELDWRPTETVPEDDDAF